VESDLAAFNSQWGLPAATTLNGKFKKVDQNGGTNYPADDTATSGNWGFEAALDVQGLHSFAPGATIILVVCNSNGFNDLFAGVKTAVTQGAKYISMSWGGAESAALVSQFDSVFSSNPSVSFFASTGDGGSASGIEYPSSSQNVVAVGGTTLYTTSTFTYADEQGWTGSTGGCSTVTSALAAQSALAGHVKNT